MNNYYNPYSRIQTYYTWLADIEDILPDSEGTSINTIHRVTEIPKSIIRNDMICLFQWKHIIVFDYESSSYKESNQKFHLEALCDQITHEYFPEKLKELFLKGNLDDIALLSRQAIPSYQLGLTAYEAIALYFSILPQRLNVPQNTYFNKSDVSIHSSYLKFYFQNKYHLDSQSQYQIKDSYRYYQYYTYIVEVNGVKSTVYQMLDFINDAIATDSCIYISLRPKRGELNIKPLKIAYDSIENQYAVLSFHQEQVAVYYLDQIASARPSNITVTADADAVLSKAPKVWGFDFNAKPVQVKVFFYNEARVWEKVRDDLSYRNGLLYEKDGYLYYEDTVYGIDKFLSWIYGYGSSAILLEPESLRNQIIDSLKRRKERL